MFLMTELSVRRRRTESSLYIVITIWGQRGGLLPHKELRLAAIQVLAEVELLPHKVVGVTRCCAVAKLLHLSRFGADRSRVRRNDALWDGHVHDEVSIRQWDVLDDTAGEEVVSDLVPVRRPRSLFRCERPSWLGSELCRRGIGILRGLASIAHAVHDLADPDTIL